jgi:hypothetical protein
MLGAVGLGIADDREGAGHKQISLTRGTVLHDHGRAIALATRIFRVLRAELAHDLSPCSM